MEFKFTQITRDIFLKREMSAFKQIFHILGGAFTCLLKGCSYDCFQPTILMRFMNASCFLYCIDARLSVEMALVRTQDSRVLQRSISFLRKRFNFERLILCDLFCLFPFLQSVSKYIARIHIVRDRWED